MFVFIINSGHRDTRQCYIELWITHCLQCILKHTSEIITVVRKRSWMFQETVCCTITECPLVRTTWTTITGWITVVHFIGGLGGIMSATIQISTGSMETHLLAKGSIGTLGKVSITPWRKSEWWFENPKVESLRDSIGLSRNCPCLFLIKRIFSVFLKSVIICVINQMFN